LLAAATATIALAVAAAGVSGADPGSDRGSRSATAAPEGSSASSAQPARRRKVREVIFVGSNWDGTVDVLRPGGKFGRIARINVIPDIDERMMEIATDPVRLGYFLGIRELVGEGNDQYVDDMYTSKDGRLLIASRPSLRDVVAISLRTGELVWRFVVDGQRSDHMAISPDGKHVAVSASTGNVVHILDTSTGAEVGRFPSGDSPHENTYSEDGKRIYHASIGLVYTPADQPQVDTSKGDRWFQVVDAKTFEILERIDMGQKLEEAGYPDMSSAVRPMAISPSERFAYFQVSFFHGFVEYDFKHDRVNRVVSLPISDAAKDMPREQYLLDSAHHGIAMNGAGTKLCVAGTMSDYAAIVNRRNLRRKLIFGGEKPYWSTTSNDGRYCFVSWSATDSISVISYKTREEIANVPVGNHPQRIRMGNVRTSWIRAQRESPAGG
jgi:YVTN family beta-propeller protein